MQAWLSGQHAQAELTLKTLSQALRDIGCSEAAAQVEAQARSYDKDSAEETTRISDLMRDSSLSTASEVCLSTSDTELEGRYYHKVTIVVVNTKFSGF